MKGKSGKKVLVLYGLLMGLLILLLEIVNYRTLIRDMDFRIYGALIAVIFLGIGLTLGYTGYQRFGKPKISLGGTTSLSQREMDVLRLMSEGLTNKEIANRLYVSLNTIKTHTSNIYAKLDVERRTQAIIKARQMNLI